MMDKVSLLYQLELGKNNKSGYKIVNHGTIKNNNYYSLFKDGILIDSCENKVEFCKCCTGTIHAKLNGEFVAYTLDI
jgi:hypothetical protein